MEPTLSPDVAAAKRRDAYFGVQPGVSGGPGTAMPLTGLMVHPFPEPGYTIRSTMETLQLATMDMPEDEQALHALAQMPRPWEPGSCTGKLRDDLWVWLEEVAIWVNEQHLWNLNRPGIPECWPAHPHIVNDLAVLACSRYYTSYALTPAALEDWHRYHLPGFLERLRDRLGDACQPARHQAPPRQERDRSLRGAVANQRFQRFENDVAQADAQDLGGRS